MAIDFPASPTPGQVFVAPGGAPVYIWNGVAWAAKVDYSGAPPGVVEFFAMNAAPVGWLKANGALVNRVTYASLFAATGTLFGVGDGSTTFALPDLRGEFLRAWDDSRGIDAARAFGSAQADLTETHTHTFTGSALAAHTHTGSTGNESADHTHYSGVAANTGTASVNHAHGLAAGGVFAGNTGTDWLTGAGGNIVKHQSATNQAGADHYHYLSVGVTSAGRSVAHTHVMYPDAITAGTPAGTVGSFGGTETRPRNVALLACIKY